MAMAEVPKMITVKLKRGGWEVEITCVEDQLQKSIESVLSTLNTNITPISTPLVEKTSQFNQNKTCRGLILALWEESWFSSPRSLSEVHEEIARRGYHYDRTAIAHSLADLVRENTLTRDGIMRNYTYIQKRPYSSRSIQNEAAHGQDERTSDGLENS